VKELDLPEDFDDAKQVHRTIMLYEARAEHGRGRRCTGAS